MKTIEQIKSMSDQEINRVIAEWCGLKAESQSTLAWEQPPNYCGDLNAVSVALQKLDEVQKESWINEIQSISPKNHFCGYDEFGEDVMVTSDFDLANGNARHRSEALVMVIQEKGK